MKHLMRSLCLTASMLVVSNIAAATAERSLPEPVSDADFPPLSPTEDDKVELGRLLFFDKILSGNQNISCGTCHHPSLGSADGVSLPLGEGARGLGTKRSAGRDLTEAVSGRVPRNSPALFNIGATQFRRLFHDGRVETDPQGYYAGGFITPAKFKLPQGLDSVLAAQAMFPVLSHVEMAGARGENEVADAVALNNAAGANGAWDILAKRLRSVSEYAVLFKRAFPKRIQQRSDITFVLAANAIAAFETRAFRTDDSPFDQYLRGQSDALSPSAARGADLFYGEAGCSSCHSGKFQTDHEFHAIAMPQIGPGKQDGFDSSYWQETGIRHTVEDFGRGRVTARNEDNYRFRTPSLRNVALTGPWGHAGAYAELEAVVRHHLDPVSALNRYTPAQAALPALPTVVEITATGSRLSQEFLSENRLQGFHKRDTWVHNQRKLRQRIADANELPPTSLDDEDINALIAFLNSLTDPASTDLAHWVPKSVPSGVPVRD